MSCRTRRSRTNDDTRAPPVAAARRAGAAAKSRSRLPRGGFSESPQRGLGVHYFARAGPGDRRPWGVSSEPENHVSTARKRDMRMAMTVRSMHGHTHTVDRVPTHLCRLRATVPQAGTGADSAIQFSPALRRSGGRGLARTARGSSARGHAGRWGGRARTALAIHARADKAHSVATTTRTTDEGGDQAGDQNRPRTFLRPFITGGGGTLLNSIPHSSQSFLRQQNSPTGKKTIAARHPHGVHVGEQHSLANSVS